MKKYYYLWPVMITVFILSCSNENKGKVSNQTKSTVLLQKETYETIATHIIDVKCGGEYIPLRNRILSKNELLSSQKGDKVADSINQKFIIDKLENGQLIRLIKSDSSGYHFIETVDRQTNKVIHQGFIMANYCKQSTIRKIEKLTLPKINKSVKSQNLFEFINGNYVPSGALLSHAFAYVSPEADFIQVLSFNIVSFNEISYKISVTQLQAADLLFTGKAEIQKYDINEKGINIIKFVAEDLLGHRMEIYINKDGSESYLLIKDKFKSGARLAPRGGDEQIITGMDETAIMQRIK